MSRVSWGTQTINESADDAIAAVTPGGSDKASALGEATEFLEGLLAAGPVAADEVWSAAKANGIADRTLKRAKKELGVVAKHSPELDGGWEWILPEGGQKSRRGPSQKSWPSSGNSAPFEGPEGA